MKPFGYALLAFGIFVFPVAFLPTSNPHWDHAKDLIFLALGSVAMVAGIASIRESER